MPSASSSGSTFEKLRSRLQGQAIKREKSTNPTLPRAQRWNRRGESPPWHRFRMALSTARLHARSREVKLATIQPACLNRRRFLTMSMIRQRLVLPTGWTRPPPGLHQTKHPLAQPLQTTPAPREGWRTAMRMARLRSSQGLFCPPHGRRLLRTRRRSQGLQGLWLFQGKGQDLWL